MTDYGKLLGVNGEFNREQFRDMMKGMGLVKIVTVLLLVYSTASRSIHEQFRDMMEDMGLVEIVAVLLLVVQFESR